MKAIADSVWKLDLPIPGQGPDSVACYLLRGEDGGFRLIDPGWDRRHSEEIVLAALQSLGAGPADVLAVFVTHFHPDHLGFAAELQSQGIPLVMAEAEQRTIYGERARWPGRESSLREQYTGWGVPHKVAEELVSDMTWLDVSATVADRLVHEGEDLNVPGFALRLVDTPGHTDGHGCFVDLRRKLAFAGDHILTELNPGIGLGGGAVDPLGRYLTSLDKLKPYDEYRLLPGHGPDHPRLRERRVGLLEHHAARAREVASVLEANPETTIWELASRITWTGGWRSLRGSHLASALAQAAQHRERLEARRD